MGLTQYDDQLDDLSGAAYERRAASATQWRERFAAIPDEALTADESIDRDLIVGTLTEQSVYDEWRVWERQPDTYLNPGQARRVRAVPAPAASGDGAGRQCRGARLRQVPPTWRPAGPTCGRSWCRRSCWIGPSTRPGQAPTTPGSCSRSRWPRSTRRPSPRLAPRQRMPSRPTPTSWSHCVLRRTATGPLARIATTSCCATPRCFPLTPAPCVSAAASRSRS